MIGKMIKIGKYELKNDYECKCIPDGVEIFADTVEKYNIQPSDFSTADWNMYGSIIVEQE